MKDKNEYPKIEETEDYGAVIDFNKPGAQHVELSALELEKLYNSMSLIIDDDDKDDEENYPCYMRFQMLVTFWMLMIGMIIGFIFGKVVF